MIEPTLVEQAWQAGPWRKTSRGFRRFAVALPAVMGVFFWAFVPLELLGAALSDSGRRELLGYAALNFGLGLAAITTAIVLKRHFAPEHRAEQELKRTGLRAHGQLLKVAPVPAAGKIPTHRFYLFGAEVPGGPPVFARMTARWGIPLGCPATIAYDPARPGDGVVVETAAELRRRARSG